MVALALFVPTPATAEATASVDPIADAGSDRGELAVVDRQPFHRGRPITPARPARCISGAVARVLAEGGWRMTSPPRPPTCVPCSSRSTRPDWGPATPEPGWSVLDQGADGPIAARRPPRRRRAARTANATIDATRADDHNSRLQC
jgi:hypothetical protein